MNRSRLTVVAALVAILALAAGVVVFTTRGSDDDSMRDRRVALDNKLDTTFGISGYMLVARPESPFTVVDSVTDSDGTTYMAGTLTMNGLRHAVVRTTKDGKTGYENFILPFDNYQLERGAWTQPLKETVPIAISIDAKGSVWVLAEGYQSNFDQKTPFVTQLKKSGLDHYSDCGSLCGIAFASWATMTDLAINPAGNRLIVTGTNSLSGFKPETGKDLEMAYGYSLQNPYLNCAQNSAATHVVAMSDRFYIVNAASNNSTAIRITFADFPTGVECADKLPLLTVSDITVDSDGSLYIYGKSTETTVGFLRMQAGAMAMYTGMGSFSPRMIDEPTRNVFPGGITASSGTLHMAASVNTLNGPKTIIEYVVSKNSTNISTAVDEVSSEVTATTPPLLTRHGSTLTLIAPTSYSGTAATLVARFTAKDPLIGAPEWPVSQQRLSLEYGQIGGLNFARPLQVSSYSLESGELPLGITLHPSLGLRGVPQRVGTFTAKIRATNSGGSSSSTITFSVIAVAPTESVITGWKQVDGNVIVEYSPGRFGSDTDTITAYAETEAGASEFTLVGECQNGECKFPEGTLSEGVTHQVRIVHSNSRGRALSANSIDVTPLGTAQKVSDITVTPGLREATVSFTEPASTEELAISRFDISIIDKESNIVVSAIDCASSPCTIDIDAPDSQRKYIASVTAVYNESYSMSAARSAEFTVKTPKSVVKFEFNADMSYKVGARQYFVIPLMAQGSDGANISAAPAFEGVVFKSNPARLEGALYPGAYEIPVTADTAEGTVTSAVQIEVTPGKLPEPDVSFAFNTFDGKLSMVLRTKSGFVFAGTKLNWKAQVNNKGLTGQCVPEALCSVNGIPFDSEITFSIQEVNDIEEPSDWVDMTVFTPSPEKPVSIDTASFKLMPSGEGIGVVEFAVRSPLARKFAFELQADATVQVDAVTDCVRNYVLEISTYRGNVVDFCPADPYARLFNGDAVLAVDDDSGSYDLFDPAALEEDENAPSYATANQFSSRLSMPVTPGSYTVEVADFTDIMTSNAERRADRSEIDLYLVIITTPEEAARLVKSTMKAEPTPVTPQLPIFVDVDPDNVVVVPPILAPAENQNLENPKVNAVANKSGANIANIAVTAGNKSLTLTPNVISTKPAALQVQITLTPGNKKCVTAAGSACTITGLSPWLTYSAAAIIPGDASGATTSGLRTALTFKAGSKVNVSTLGLAAAAKSLNASVAKKSLRATGRCSLNAAQTVLTVGRTGSCTVSVRTTKTVKKKTLVGPSLSLRAVIK